jgi:hypothetical protein
MTELFFLFFQVLVSAVLIGEREILTTDDTDQW